jgi:hypothetical protein
MNLAFATFQAELRIHKQRNPCHAHVQTSTFPQKEPIFEALPASDFLRSCQYLPHRS